MVFAVVSEPVTPAVELAGVVKRFRGEGARRRIALRPARGGGADARAALHRLDLVVPRGQTCGVLGVNGSGKSTLVRILSTLLIPDSGVARVFGRDVVTEAASVRRYINRVSVEAAFFKELSPWENLLYSARLHGAAGELRQRATTALDRLGLPRTAFDKPMKTLSRGQQQKVAIARSLLTSPSLLLMDEPTTGLDPRSKREVQAFLRELRAENGVTILLCTHDLDEAERLCERLIVLHAGRVLADGSPAQLRASGGEPVSLEEVFMRLTGRSLEDDTEDPEQEETG